MALDDAPRRLARAGLLLSIWTAVSLASLASGLLQYRVAGAPVPWSRLISDVAGWYLWLALLPIAWVASHRFPLERARLRTSLPANLLLALAAASAYAVLVVLKNQLVVNLATGTWRLDLLYTVTGYFFGGLPLYLLTYGLLVACLHASSYYRRLRQRELLTTRLEARLAESHLQILKMQLDPHFLFNSLNAIATLIADDPDAAEAMVDRLARFLRLTLAAERQQEVALRRELEFLHLYIDLEKVRFGHRLEVELRIDAETLPAQVPHLVLQPLVENAVRHGMTARGLRVAVIARRRRGDRLELAVEDDGAGPSSNSGEGVGLTNVRRRLEHLYGAEQTFLLAARPAGGAAARMTLPFRLSHPSQVLDSHAGGDRATLRPEGELPR